MSLTWGKKLHCIFVTCVVKGCVCTNQSLRKWTFFAGFWLKGIICQLWKMRLSLKVPYAEQRPFIYNFVKTFIVKYKVNSLALEEISCARLEQLVCTEGLALLPVGTLVEEDCRTVWRNVSASYLLNAHRDLAWSVVHQCLPLRSFLYRRGGTASPVCIRPGCWGEETVHHLMWSCSFAQEVWQKMCIWLAKIERKIILTEYGILYGLLGIKISKEKFCKIWSIINSTKDALWKARNILQWKKCDLSAEAVYALALSVAKDYVARDVVHRSREEVSKIWGLEKEQMISQIVLRC